MASAYVASKAVKIEVTEATSSTSHEGSARSRRKSTNKGSYEASASEESQQDGDGWISVGPKHHGKSFNHEEASHQRKKFNETLRQGRNSFSANTAAPKNGPRERKKPAAAKEHPKKGRAKSEAVKDKEAFRALSAQNPEWASESAIVDSEADLIEPFSMQTSQSATEQFEAWKTKMKGVSFADADPVPAPSNPVSLLAPPPAPIPITNRFRRSSNYEDLIWGTSSSPQSTLMMQRRQLDDRQPQESKFKDIFNPSSPKSAGSSQTGSPSVTGNTPLAVPQHSSSKLNNLLGTSPQLNSGQMYYSSSLGNILNIGAPLRATSELPYGQTPKYQSEYLKQITTFHTNQ